MRWNDVAPLGNCDVFHPNIPFANISQESHILLASRMSIRDIEFRRALLYSQMHGMAT
jgi:hypothetical protein